MTNELKNYGNSKHSIFKRKALKDFKIYVGFTVIFLSCHKLKMQRTIKCNTIQMNSGVSVEWKNYCLLFRFEHSYISLSIFPFL